MPVIVAEKYILLKAAHFGAFTVGIARTEEKAVLIQEAGANEVLVGDTASRLTASACTRGNMCIHGAFVLTLCND